MAIGKIPKLDLVFSSMHFQVKFTAISFEITVILLHRHLSNIVLSPYEIVCPQIYRFTFHAMAFHYLQVYQLLV